MRRENASSQGICLFLCLIPVIGSAQTRSNTIMVPGGTQIPIHVVGTVSSASLKDGDTFQFQAAEDVVVNGMIVVHGGSLGSGTIGEVDHAGGNGHSGSVALDFNWIYAVDGGRVHLANTTQKQAEDDRKGAASTATIIGFATFGLGGLFGHNLAHGREGTIDEKKIFHAFVASNVHVAASERAEQQEHFDH